MNKRRVIDEYRPKSSDEKDPYAMASHISKPLPPSRSHVLFEGKKDVHKPFKRNH